MFRLPRPLARLLRSCVRTLAFIVLCLGALGPGAPPPPPAPRRQQEVQVAGERDEDPD